MSTNNTTGVMYLRARYRGSEADEYEIEQRQLEAQRQACMAAAERMGVTLVREYAEHGGTGPIEGRPELRLMLDELTALRDVAYVFVTGLDRLARRAPDLASIRLEIEAAGAELVATDAATYHRTSEIAGLLETLGSVV